MASMQKTSTSLRGWIAILVLIALTLASCNRTKLPILPVGGDFVLTDDNNQRFELSSLRGKAVLVFFGYTSCPDICPTTLSKLSSVYKQLGPDAARVKTIYISVDPQRDTPQVLKEDLSSFDLDAVGVTGPKADIDKVVAEYGASYEFIPTPESELKYTVAHSTTLYALDTNGRTRILFPYDATIDQIVTGIRQILGSQT
jgi:protein SCO1/2